MLMKLTPGVHSAKNIQFFLKQVNFTPYQKDISDTKPGPPFSYSLSEQILSKLVSIPRPPLLFAYRGTQVAKFWKLLSEFI